MFNFSNKTVIVTGASRGIGKAIIEAFLAQGAQVIATATSVEGCQKITESYHNIQAHPLDLKSQDSISKFLEYLKLEGVEPDILINNAGITSDQLSIRLKANDWHNVVDVNLTGTFLLTQGIIKMMLRKNKGRVITISSVVAFKGSPGQANYCAAKAGLVGMTKSLAIEFARKNITFNVIAPGFIETDMTSAMTEEQQKAILSHIPTERMGRPSEIASGCLYLASDEASYVTGTTLHINGGLYI